MAKEFVKNQNSWNHVLSVQFAFETYYGVKDVRVTVSFENSPQSFTNFQIRISTIFLTSQNESYLIWQQQMNKASSNWTLRKFGIRGRIWEWQFIFEKNFHEFWNSELIIFIIVWTSQNESYLVWRKRQMNKNQSAWENICFLNLKFVKPCSDQLLYLENDF